MQCEHKLKSGGDGGIGDSGALLNLCLHVLIYVQSTLLQYQELFPATQTPGFYGAPGQVAGSIILSPGTMITSLSWTLGNFSGLWKANPPGPSNELWKIWRKGPGRESLPWVDKVEESAVNNAEAWLSGCLLSQILPLDTSMVFNYKSTLPIGARERKTKMLKWEIQHTLGKKMEFEGGSMDFKYPHNSHPPWPGACFTGSQTPFLQFRWMSAPGKEKYYELSLLGLLRHWPGGFLELTRPPLYGRGKGIWVLAKRQRFCDQNQEVSCAKKESLKKKKKKGKSVYGQRLNRTKSKPLPNRRWTSKWTVALFFRWLS